MMSTGISFSNTDGASCVGNVINMAATKASKKVFKVVVVAIDAEGGCLEVVHDKYVLAYTKEDALLIVGQGLEPTRPVGFVGFRASVEMLSV